ncbi:MAG: hypothetical protein ACI84E_000508 [Planctomycetota bacterium]
MKRKRKKRKKGLPNGFLLIQIDGLGQDQLIRAIRARKAPFLRNLLRGRHQGGFHMQGLRPGLPSTTPTVQAELLYGKHLAFPGFRYIRRSDGRDFYFGNLGQVGELEQECFGDSKGILRENGSSFFNIFHGGADSVRFTSSALGKGELWPSGKGKSRALLHLAKLVLTTTPFLIWLFLVEIAYELKDMARAYWKREIVRGQVSFLVRGLVRTLGDELGLALLLQDMGQGRQHIMVNLIGYDKAAHMRGPDHGHALRSMRQTDRLVKKLWRASKRSRAVDYDFFVFSDHGMTPAKPVAKETGQDLESMLRTHFSYAAQAMGKQTPDLWVRATGSLAHVYLARTGEPWLQERITEALPGMDEYMLLSPFIRWWVTRFEGGDLRLCEKVEGEAGPTFVAHRLQEGKPTGQAPLTPLEAAELFAMASHPDAGELFLFGARDGERVWNFLWEYGCHGGFEPEEQNAFLILPGHLGPSPHDHDYVTAGDMNRFFERHYFGASKDAPKDR